KASRAIDNDLWRPTDEGSAAERPSTATASAASGNHAESLSRSSTAVAREASSSMTVMTRRAITRKERTASTVFTKGRDKQDRFFLRCAITLPGLGGRICGWANTVRPDRRRQWNFAPYRPATATLEPQSARPNHCGTRGCAGPRRVRAVHR